MRLAYTSSHEEQRITHIKVCDLMDNLQASYNPVNYLVCYEYILGENKSLVEEIDELRSNNQKWSNILGVRLKEKHIDSYEKHIIQAENDLITSINEHCESMKYRINELESHLNDLNNSHKDASIITHRAIRAVKFIDSINQKHNKNVSIIRERLLEHKKKTTMDLLTRLNNENHMQMILPRVVDSCKKDKKLISLNLIDIEGFSNFNQEYGHELADNLLAYYGKKIKEIGQGFASWRIGPDEFLIAYTYMDEDDKFKTINSLVASLSNAKLRPKGKEEGLKSLFALKASIIYDFSLSLNSNINFLYSALEEEKLLQIQSRSP